jgi:hypothetical protein
MVGVSKMTIINVANMAVDKTRFYYAEYRGSRSGMSTDPWSGYVVSFSGEDEPVITGLLSKSEADSIAWERNISEDRDIPSYALQYGLLSKYSMI